MADEPQKQNENLFQQIGNIQGTLTALNGNITDFKTELRSLTSDQNRRIDDVRKEMHDEFKSIATNYEDLQSKKLDKVEALRYLAEAGEVHKTFVTKEDFDPVRKLVYGCVGLTLLTVGGALLYLVVNHAKF